MEKPGASESLYLALCLDPVEPQTDLLLRAELPSTSIVEAASQMKILGF